MIFSMAQTMARVSTKQVISLALSRYASYFAPCHRRRDEGELRDLGGDL
jgi:hypothetical protein